MSYLSDVNKIAEKLMEKDSNLRIGYAYSKAIYIYDNEQYNRIIWTSLDPLYKIENLGRFLTMLADKGDSLTKVQT